MVRHRSRENLIPLIAVGIKVRQLFLGAVEIVMLRPTARLNSRAGHGIPLLNIRNGLLDSVGNFISGGTVGSCVYGQVKTGLAPHRAKVDDSL